MKESISGSLPSLLRHKGILLHGIILLLLVFLLSTLTSHLIISYREKTEAEQRIAMMQSYLREWEAKSEELAASPMRPVGAAQADRAQTEIVFAIQSGKLNLVSMKGDQRAQEANGKAYTAEFTGSYADTMRFLAGFGTRGALVGIRHLSLAAKDGQIKAELAYKIYTK